MNKIQQQVKDFMLRAKQECPDKARVPSAEDRILRARLILEEALEYIEASGLEAVFNDKQITMPEILIREDDPCGNPADLVSMADAVADLLYVTYGSAVSCGLDMEPIQQSVHENNLSKFDDCWFDDFGKLRKGPNYLPVDLAPLVNQQR